MYTRADGLTPTLRGEGGKSDYKRMHGGDRPSHSQPENRRKRRVYQLRPIWFPVAWSIFHNYSSSLRSFIHIYLLIGRVNVICGAESILMSRWVRLDSGETVDRVEGCVVAFHSSGGVGSRIWKGSFHG